MLTEQQRADRKMTGAAFQEQIVEVAEILGWHWLHLRPAQTLKGWRTPVQGPLGAGWPDLVLVHPGRKRTIAIEVKREIGDKPTDDQLYVHGILRSAGWEVRVYRPSDLAAVSAELGK